MHKPGGLLGTNEFKETCSSVTLNKMGAIDVNQFSKEPLAALCYPEPGEGSLATKKLILCDAQDDNQGKR